MASDSGLSAGSRVISGQAGNLGRSDCGVKLPGNGRPRPLPPPYPRRGEIWGGSRPVRGGQAGTLARCECEVKFPGNGRPRPLPPPYPRRGEIWGGSRPVWAHLGSAQRQN